MKKIVLAIMMIALACSMVFAQAAPEAASSEGTHYTFRIGCSDQAWRAQAIQEAANRLNAELAAEGSKDTVEVIYDVVDDFNKTLPLWIKENNLPEFIAQTSGIITKYGKEGVIIDSKDIVLDEAHKIVPENLRDLGLVDGKYNGILLDTEVRFVIVYKPALVALGWTEEQIEAWKNDARDGKITCYDLQALAKQVVDAGICEYGITHRPNKGADWRYTFITWNHGEIPVDENGKVIISKQNIKEFLSFWRENVQLGITPYNHLTDFNWDMLEGDIWPNGKSFCWYGQIASKGDIMSAGKVTSEYVDENYFTIPLPVTDLNDSPVGGSNPYFYGLTTAAQKDAKTFEYCSRIMDLVLADDIQLTLSLATTHLGITTTVVETPEYKADKWMSDQTYMNEYMFILPENDALNKYANSQEFFNALQEAEVKANDSSARSIDAIVDELVAKMTFNMGEGNYIIVD